MNSSVDYGHKYIYLLFLGQSDLKGFSVQLDTNPTILFLMINWDNKDKILNKGILQPEVL